MFNIIRSFVNGYRNGPTTHRHMMRTDKKVRRDLDENQVDAMTENSFPASDPPSTY